MSPFKAEIRTQLRLAFPVVVAQLGMMAMGVVDTLMVGHLDGEGVAEIALAAVGLGHIAFFVCAVFAGSSMMAVDPLVAQGLGARDDRAVALAIQRGVVLLLVFSAVFAFPLLFVEPILESLEQPPEIVPKAAAYARLMLPSLPLFLAFGLLRQVLVALHRTRPILLAVLFANLANVAADYAFIHGHWGMPRMEVVGSAWATLCSRGIMVGLLLWFSWSEIAPRVRPLQLARAIKPRPLLRMLRIGLPVGCQSLFEFMAFAALVPLMGWLGSLQAAGHMVAINLASLAFMIPLGISSAASVRAGHAVGLGDPDGVRRSAGVSILLGMAAMVFSATLFLTAPRFLAELYTEDAAVIGMAVLLIPLAGVFQLFDGLQVVALGVLRGVGDTLVPMWIALVGYWLIGFPFGYWLAFERGYDARGLWWGLVVGLACVSIVLSLRVRQRLARDLFRLEVEG